MASPNLRIVRTDTKRAAASTMADAVATAAACAIEPLPGWNKRQFAIFLLQTAADIEHALLVQYLYAAYSLPTGNAKVQIRDPKTGNPVLADPKKPPTEDNIITTATWAGQISGIAQEEMGHLLSIQCLLRALGGPIGFDREHFPYRSQLYPFPFTLEPLTKNSLARYVVAEMPDPTLIDPNVLTPAQIEEIRERATRDTGGVAINHVGMLYDSLINVVLGLDETDFRQDAIPYQPTDREVEDDWRANARDDDDGIKVLPIRPLPDGKVTKLKDVACRSLRIIARQGEGMTKTIMKGRKASTKDRSHFRRFLSIYKQFPDGLAPALPVATNPNTTVPPCPALNNPSDPETAIQEQKSRGGRILNSITLLWAHLFNIRYRILLAELHHYLLLRADKPEQAMVRARLVLWIFREMTVRSDSSIASLARLLTRLDQYGFPGFKAGAPFEIPFTFALPDRGPDRWQIHRDLYYGSKDLVNQLKTAMKTASQPALDELAKFEDQDDGFDDKNPIGRIGVIEQYKDSEF